MLVLNVSTENFNSNIMRNLILLFALLNVSHIQSQIIDKYSISTKGTMDILSNFYFEGYEINVFSKSYLYSIGYYYGEDYEFLGDAPTEKYNQLNLLFGKYIDTKNEKFRFQYQGGIGMFWGLLRTDQYNEENSGILTNTYFTKEVSTVGFPLKIGGRYIPFKFLSIGIDLQANFNFQKFIFRPMLSIEIGKLRSSKNEKPYKKTLIQMKKNPF